MNENIFKDIEDKSQKAPEELKNMVVSELNFIRNSLEVATIFLGLPFDIFLKAFDNNNDQTKK